jgi:hypothetical protein
LATTYKTVQTYECDGIQRIFTFPFDYLRTSFVKCSLDALEQVNGTDYSVPASLKQVEFSSAPAAGVILKIYRETTTDHLVTWADASVLRAKDLTVFEVQLLHVAEETKDAVQAGGMALDDIDGKWQGGLHVIKDLLDPENPGDAVTLRYLESAKGAVITAKDTAITKAAEASLSAEAASASELAARMSEVNAEDSETVATTKATESSLSASTATTKAAEASASAISALASKDASAISETNAALSAAQAATFDPSLYATKAQQAWQTPTLLNGWVQFGAPYPTVQYYKDSIGVVHLRGCVKSGTIGIPITVLPVGYRPGYSCSFSTPSNTGVGIMVVQTDGTIMPAVGSNSSLLLDGISFRVEG